MEADRAVPDGGDATSIMPFDHDPEIRRILVTLDRLETRRAEDAKEVKELIDQRFQVIRQEVRENRRILHGADGGNGLVTRMRVLETAQGTTSWQGVALLVTVIVALISLVLAALDVGIFS